MQKPVTHMIGNAHIDPAWLWRWPDGFAEIKATFRSALDRMNEFPDFIFTCAGSLYYRWVAENEPAMFEEIRSRVAQGRWVIVGGWLVQPDCNIPCGESFVRHGLYGQRYFLEKFGLCAKVGYNVDSFGHNAMLPQILKKSGMDSYVMMRPQSFEMELPANTFWWEAPDGSRVRASRIPVNYASYWGDPDPLFEKQAEVLKQAQHGHTDAMNFYGVGNHGGGPTIRNILTVHALQKEYGAESIRFSSPNAYFESLERSGITLPVVRTELQHHASGCYSAHLRTKQNNRRAEQALLHAERVSVLCEGLLGGTYSTEIMQSAWEKVLFNQFHDIMGGCSVPEVYEDAKDFYGYAMTIAMEAANHAQQRIAWHIDTLRAPAAPLSRDKDWLTWEKENLGVPVVVFNSLSWEITAPVVIDRKLAGITQDDGTPVAHQTIRAPRSDLKNIWDSVFLATVPAMGYRVYWIYCDQAFEIPRSQVQADPETFSMENEFVRIAFDPQTGAVGQWVNKRTGVPLFHGPAALPVVLDETHIDTWGHSRNCWDREIGRFGSARVRVLESGPVRSKVRATSRYGESELQQDFILYANSPALEVEASLIWRERHKMLKLTFPLNAQDPRSFYQIPYGAIERPTNGEEEPCQQWADVCGMGPDGLGTGLAVINTGNQSACVRENVLGFTVVRSPIFAESAGLHMENEGVHEPECPCMEQGLTQFRYTLYPHGFDGTISHAALLTREAAQRNLPFAVRKETYHPGELPREYCGLSIGASHVKAEVLKRAEDGGGHILRVHETCGQACSTRVDCPILGRSFEASLGAYEIATFYLPADPASPVCPADLLERIVE